MNRRAAIGGVAGWLAALAGDASAASEPRVVLQTEKGRLEIDVHVRRAPLSAADFLRYVDRGLYEGGAFYRTVRPDNDRGAARIDVIQGGLLDLANMLPPVPHESTIATGLRHRDGTVSLARGAVGSGSAVAFFICVGDQPALDHGGARNPDGQGFAAFGRVVGGMDVARAIWRLPARGPGLPVLPPGLERQVLRQPVQILSAARASRPVASRSPVEPTAVRL